ncbi:MAG TPA: winged helix-turn-helix domain-containing protein [Candidatus Angelobacter sp.]|nr:winged helix-turn-helix domain-containing protein [Candidatus Angelobacter sp.]
MPTALKYQFDQFEADVNAAELRRNGIRLKLQMQPFQVLVALLERPRDVVTREELRQRLWPQDTFVDFDHGLNTAMAKLRDVLGDSAGNPRYIETIAKRGYRFLGEAQIVQTPVSASLIATANPPATHAAEASAPRTIPPISAGAPEASDLPRARRGTTRVLFVLAQIMYVIFYISALFDWQQLHRASFMIWPGEGTAVFVTFLVTAMAGVAVRLYLITATSFDYHLLGEKYRILFPALLVLDMIWALSPLLLADRMGIGLALGASAALIYMPFAQRVLMKMIARRA